MSVADWFGWGTREDVARVERKLEEQRRAIDSQHAVLTAIGQSLERLVAVEGHLAGLTARVETHEAGVRASIEEVRAGVDQSFDSVMQSLKAVRQGDKSVTQDLRKLVRSVARLSGTFNLSVDAPFLDVARPLVDTRRTLLGYDRLFTLWQAAANVAHLQAAAAEVGTFRGGSAALLAQALSRLGGRDPELHVVDTFEGHLDATLSGHDPEEQRGKFRGVSEEEVRAFLSAFPGVHVHVGDGPAVIAGWPERQYALAHLDVDLYQPSLACLQYFGPRLLPGGVIVVDDYDAPTCPGVRVAVQEFLAHSSGFHTWTLATEQLVLVRSQGSAE